MQPSTALRNRKDRVLEIARAHRMQRLRVFGSVLHGTDREGSDLDLLVDAPQGTTLFDLAGFEEELREALGVPVQVLTEGDLPQRIRGRVLAEAKPL